jgi:hypothetical protein
MTAQQARRAQPGKYCELCELPKAQCVHGLERRRAKAQRRKAAKAVQSKAVGAARGKRARAKGKVDAQRKACGQCRKSRCKSCKSQRRPRSVWVVASAGSPGLGRRA